MKKKSTKNIQVAFLLNLFFSVIELIGGLYTNSIAIISDSLHDFGDSLAIATSWFLEKKAQQKPDESYTYGYARFSVLGALISTMFLFITSLFVIYNAIPRIIKPESIDYNGVLLLAILGLGVNGFAAYKTAKGTSLNEKAINLHLLEDVFGWAAVLIVGVTMKIFNIPVLDPILSVIITSFILFRVFKNLKAIFEVFLEKAPADLDIQELKAHLLTNKAVKDIHHLHLWTIDGINRYIMLHAIISKESSPKEIIAIKKFIREELREHQIQHITIELEFTGEKCLEPNCQIENNHKSHIGHNH